MLNSEKSECVRTMTTWYHGDFILRIPDEFFEAYQELMADDVIEFDKKPDSKIWKQKFKLENILKMPVYGFNSGKVTKQSSRLTVFKHDLMYLAF